MSSESDGDGSPRGWTLVDNHGRTEDSDDSTSGSSSDFVDLGETSVQYHHVRRSSNMSDVTPSNSPTRSSATLSGLPANFRAHSVEATASPQVQRCTPPEDDDHSIVSGDLFSFAASGEAADLPQLDEAAGPSIYGGASAAGLEASAQGRIEDEQSSDLDKSSSTLTGSQSPLCSASNAPENREDQEGHNIQAEGSPANIQPSVKLSDDDAETEALSSVAASLDSISVDSIEVLSLPSDGCNFPGGEAQVMMSSELEAGRGGTEGIRDDSSLETVPALVSMSIALPERDETIPRLDPEEDADRSFPSEDSDTSEFERIEPENLPAVEEIQNQPNEHDEENKMNVAGARPTEEAEAEDIQNFLFRPSRPFNFEETGSHDQDGLFMPHLHPVNLLPPPNPSEPGPSVSRVHPWRAPLPLTSGIRPFPLDSLPEDSLDGHCLWAPSGPQFHGRLGGIMRQHSSNSSEEGFELVPRSRRQDDDAASSVSSSSSDISGFVNVRQRHGPQVSPSVSSRHSNNDDMLDSVSNFTDLSEDSLPANMMIQSQKSGLKQYRHHRDEGLNTRLDWMVAMVLLVGLALGIGHFIGSTQEMAHQRSIHTGQVQRLRELQDDLVTCLDRSTGIDSRVMTEKTSPALQAVKLLEGLNVKMQKEVVDSSHLLEQKVGPDDRELVKKADSEDCCQSAGEAIPKREDEALDDLGGTTEEKEAVTDELLEPQVSTRIDSSDSSIEEGKDLSRGLELENYQETIEVKGLPEDDKDSPSMTLTDKIEIASNNDEPVPRAASVVSDDSEDSRDVKELKVAKENPEDTIPENVLIKQQVQPEVISKEMQPDGEGIKMKTDEDSSVHIETPPDSSDQIPESPKSVDPGLPLEPSRPDPEASTVEMLKRKIEMMEEKMNKVIKTAEQWQEMLEKSKRTDGNFEEDQSQAPETDQKSRPDKEDAEDKGKDRLSGIAATLEGLWPGLLDTDQGMQFLQYINQTLAASGSYGHYHNETASWWEAFYREVVALKSWPGESEEVQMIVNNTLLLAAHLGKEMETMTGYVRNQSAKLVEENNITMEGLGEHASKAWTKLLNVTADVMDYNRMVLSIAGEHLADTLHVMENVSAEIISKQNLSMASISNVAEQVWGTLKNYSTNMKDKIMNSTSQSTTDQSGSSDDKTSEDESDENAGGGFGEQLKSAWERVHSYSSNFTSKQNLSISGLREQVKVAWGKVKNTSAQVLDDISESSLAGTLRDGAKKLSEKVGTTLKSVKEKAKGFDFHKRGCHGGWKKKKQEQRQKRKEEKQNRKHHHHQKHKYHEAFHSGKGNKKETSNKQHHSHHKVHRQGGDRSKKDKHDKPRETESQDSVPSRKHQHGPQHDNTEKFHSPKEPKDEFHSASGSHGRKQPTGSTETVPEESPKPSTSRNKQNHHHQQEKQHSVPSRHQTKEPIKSNDAKSTGHSGNSRQGTHDKEKMTQREYLKEAPKRCPPHQARSGSKENQEVTEDSNWEDLFNCVDMHCKGDQECMHSQRRDAAKLYTELLDYQKWLKERNLRKDVKELKEFLEELGEFLSETDSSDQDLDDLKDEFGEMVQDMEDGARRRERKRSKMQGKKHPHSRPDQDSTAYLNDPDGMEENSTVIINLKTLPQQQEQESDHFKSSSQSGTSPNEGERRKYAGRGYQSSSDDDGDWYQQRAKDRAEQRRHHHWSKDRNPRDASNWYLHWVQGRINGRTGVTVWDMYEWIKERYIVREALRSHEMEDHTNWFLRRP